jgi:putative Ig domain-containing protein
MRGIIAAALLFACVTALVAGAAGASTFGAGQTRLEYAPLVVTAGRTIEPHRPTQVEHTGTAAFSVAPPLPAGLSLDPATGTVTGRPAAAKARTTHTVTMQDSTGEISAPLVVTVTAAPDVTAPPLKVGAAPRQRAVKLGKIVVRAKCAEPCALRGKAGIVVAGTQALISVRTVNAARFTTAPRALSLRLTKSAAARVARFLAQGRRVRAIVTVRARDKVGNARQASRGITIGP